MSMFGALNRFISRLDSDGLTHNVSSGHGSFGFQVLRNKSSDIAIEPWYDFVVGINGRSIDDPNSNLFATEVRNCAGSSVVLAIWNAKGQRIRMLHVPILRESPALGITLQWTPLSTTEDVWHVLDVIPDSPADKAGLLPYGDYIIGTPEGLVHGESGLGELVEDYLSRPLRLYVYNHEYAVTRLVTITPSRHWGGNGALGCVLGFGALHRLPLPLAEPPAEPGDTLFETARFSNEEARLGQGQAQTHPGNMAVYPPTQGQPSGGLLVPATMSTPPPPGGATAFTPRPARNKRHGVSPNRAFDEYFQEGEQKSKQEDFTPSTKATPPPPPPKTGAVHGATKDPKPIAANEEHDP